MTNIRTLFDGSKGLDRRIEKVITYGSNAEKNLKAEISEYVVTDHLCESMHELLERMQTAMNSNDENEIGVWVSGFYGSGKSSLSKYIGMALDDRITVDGTPFLQHFSDRIRDARTKALLNTVAKRFPASVVMVDLASEQSSGASMEDVATVLYYKVLKWAGYSRNLKVASFERRLKKDGRYAEFEEKFSEMLEGETWQAYQDDPSVVDFIIPELAHQMYPKFWPHSDSFKTDHQEMVFTVEQQAQEIIDIVRETSNKEYCIFIFDEIGNYVGPREKLIFKLQGFAQIIKQLGKGKVWIFGTAQQTLAEDDKSAALNSPELYKLIDRFPIDIRLKSSDIKEICYLRLLGKSADGESQLKALFESNGQSLRHATKLEGNKFYEADVDEKSFVNLYPFLPAHFELLLNLLGVLAKSTGGIGLRSAIKVIHDVLVEGIDDQAPIADQSVGWLATSVTLYDALEKDIGAAFATKHKAVGRLYQSNWYDSANHQGVAKTVALLEILNNLPITRQNVAALMHGNVTNQSQKEVINQAIEDLINDPKVPLAEKDGELTFFSEKLNDIEQERHQLRLPSIELRKIISSALRDVMSPLPSVSLNGSRAVQTGIKYNNESGLVSSLNGERNPIQTVIEFVSSTDFDVARTRLVDASRHSNHEIYLLARTSAEVDELVNEAYRCDEIANRYRNETEKEIKDYCKTQKDRAANLIGQIETKLRRNLINGEFIFGGNATAVEGYSQELIDACKKHLLDAAKQVFNRYQEAPVQVNTNVAEKFIRADNLSLITTEIDPLTLVEKTGGSYSINESQQAITSIKDYIETRGGVDGKVLSDHFSRPPFGWSQDTLRYLVAAMFVGGLVKFKVAGQELTSSGQKAIEAIKTNNTFKNIGVNLRDDRPSPEMCMLASGRLTELTGDSVFPMEDDISKAAVKYFNKAQHDFGSLAAELRNLGIPGEDKAESLRNDLASMLLSDCSDAPQRLGAEESQVFKSLIWATSVQLSFKQGLDKTLKSLSSLIHSINTLPDSGVPGKLKTEAEEEINVFKEKLNRANFYEYTADFNASLTTLNSLISSRVIELQQEQEQSIKQAQLEVANHVDWQELTTENKEQELKRFDSLALTVATDVDGLKRLISQEFNISQKLKDVNTSVTHKAQVKRVQRVAEEKAKYEKEGKVNQKIERKVTIPKRVTQKAELEQLIQMLQQLKGDLELNSDIEIHLDFES
ncbi:BREX system P-loop protein BrxC [Aliiglaciecola sp. 2_MG-2023]|uniref:BREX system P-loop protein BrxC n=1 Tax=unclassified Aliiglaciecola TaxID=2593648 RepID=UPI0026E154C4|nr:MULTISPECIES: BREX system P-loop protein BrxC [unclassified Aliiglaciecola]MDO6710342.1 BREX system P-loop protein BrxC [Aliiglaciecola sp. 2_MG-2023]MDO6751489.1 BREX system P-loop protein BrxC [Aliiglaciecola sp. 1_MG-2023]